MQNVLVKVYGFLESPDRQGLENCLIALQEICTNWYLDSDIIELDGNIMTFSFEGTHFPVDDIAKELQKYISEQSKGKLDYLDLENWTLTRFFLDFEHNKNQFGQGLYYRKSSLNHAIVEAQEKCGQYKCSK